MKATIIGTRKGIDDFMYFYEERDKKYPKNVIHKKSISTNTTITNVATVGRVTLRRMN